MVPPMAKTTYPIETPEAIFSKTEGSSRQQRTYLKGTRYLRYGPKGTIAAYLKGTRYLRYGPKGVITDRIIDENAIVDGTYGLRPKGANAGKTVDGNLRYGNKGSPRGNSFEISLIYTTSCKSRGNNKVKEHCHTVFYSYCIFFRKPVVFTQKQ